ncbi:MAG: hypothetical protein AB7O74_07800 [Candidatus Nanopelagicales bacterium]
MSAPTLDQPATGTTAVPARRRWIGPLLAVVAGIALAAAITWLLVATVTLDIAPAAVGM